MDTELVTYLKFTILYSTIPGALGGLTSFLFALKRGHYQHNKYVRKLSIEIVGAMLTASFISALFTSKIYMPVAAFIIGITWSGVIQLIRVKITKIVEAALGEAFERGDD